MQDYVSPADFKLMTGYRIKVAHRLTHVSAGNAAVVYTMAAKLRQMIDQHVLASLIHIPPRDHVRAFACASSSFRS
jgi:hypothetical protein